MLPPCDGTARIDRQHRDLMAALEQVDPEALDESALADAGRAGNAHAHRPARVRHEFFENRPAALGLFRSLAFEQGDGFRHGLSVAAANGLGLFFRGASALAHELRARITWSTSRAAPGTAVPGPKIAATPLLFRNS